MDRVFLFCEVNMANHIHAMTNTYQNRFYTFDLVKENLDDLRTMISEDKGTIQLEHGTSDVSLQYDRNFCLNPH
eukprot:UN05650